MTANYIPIPPTKPYACHKLQKEQYNIHNHLYLKILHRPTYRQPVHNNNRFWENNRKTNNFNLHGPPNKKGTYPVTRQERYRDAPSNRVPRADDRDRPEPEG